VHEVEESFGSEQKGSSAMPHKRTDHGGEAVRAGAASTGQYGGGRRKRGLWHERDISHSSVERVIIPDSTIALDHMLTQFAGLVRNLKVFPANMKATST